MRFFKTLRPVCLLRVVCLAVLFLAVTGAVSGARAEAQVQGDTATANADSSALPPVDVLPASMAPSRGLSYEPDGITHPEIRMTPDKSDIVRLEKPAFSVIVGNPVHLGVLVDSAQMLVLVPREPGATYFTVLGKDGEVLMQRHVIVAAPKEKYVRVRRSCAGSKNDGCEQTSVFYCPGMCHRIVTTGQERGDGGASAAQALVNSYSGGAARSALDDQGGGNGGGAGSEAEIAQ